MVVLAGQEQEILEQIYRRASSLTGDDVIWKGNGFVRKVGQHDEPHHSRLFLFEALEGKLPTGEPFRRGLPDTNGPLDMADLLAWVQPERGILYSLSRDFGDYTISARNVTPSEGQTLEQAAYSAMLQSPRLAGRPSLESLAHLRYALSDNPQIIK